MNIKKYEKLNLNIPSLLVFIFFICLKHISFIQNLIMQRRILHFLRKNSIPQKKPDVFT